MELLVAHRGGQVPQQTQRHLLLEGGLVALPGKQRHAVLDVLAAGADGELQDRACRLAVRGQVQAPRARSSPPSSSPSSVSTVSSPAAQRCSAIAVSHPLRKANAPRNSLTRGNTERSPGR